MMLNPRVGLRVIANVDVGLWATPNPDSRHPGYAQPGETRCASLGTHRGSERLKLPGQVPLWPILHRQSPQWVASQVPTGLVRDFWSPWTRQNLKHPRRQPKRANRHLGMPSYHGQWHPLPTEAFQPIHHPHRHRQWLDDRDDSRYCS